MNKKKTVYIDHDHTKTMFIDIYGKRNTNPMWVVNKVFDLNFILMMSATMN